MACVGEHRQGDELTMNGKITATVARLDGSSDSYLVTPKALVEFERHFNVGFTKAIVEDDREEHKYWLAWKAEHLAGKVVKPFDGWMDDIRSAVLEYEAAPLDATA